jgi:hypothetical protein
MIALICFAILHTYYPSPEEQAMGSFCWEKTECTPFDTLIPCWNGPDPGPERGYALFVSLLQKGDWSAWIPIADEGDKMFGAAVNYTLSPIAEMTRGVVLSKNGPCTGFQILLLSWQSQATALLQLFVSTSDSKSSLSTNDPPLLPSVLLPQMPRISQIAISRMHSDELSLPAALSVAIGQILGNPIDSLAFCEATRDPEFGCRESWLWNTAVASRTLGDGYRVYVDFLSDLTALHDHLLDGFPVVVAVRGYLPGCAQPYAKDHTVCIYGYDANAQLIYAIDGGFRNSRSSATTFPVADFLRSWKRTGNKACIIEPRRA